MKRLIQSATLLAGLALAGATWGQEPANPLAKPAQPADPAKAPEAAKEAALSVPVVTLIDAGAEPRQVLRLIPAVGQEQAVKMRMGMSMSMKRDETEFPRQSLPAILMTFKTKVASVAPEGDIHYEFAFTECTVEEGGDGEPQLIDMIKGAIAPFTKITGTCQVSSRGVSKEVKLVAPEDMDPGAEPMLEGMKQQMGQMSAPFPEEAVGTGAKWKVETKVKAQGMTIDQTSTVELIELKDGIARMGMSVEQNAPAQKIDVPGAGQVDVKSFKSAGTGKVEQKLGSLAPTSSTLKMGTDMSLSSNQNGESHSMTQHIALDLSFGPVEASKPEKADKPAEVPAK